jgi:hypothetical protein
MYSTTGRPYTRVEFPMWRLDRINSLPSHEIDQWNTRIRDEVDELNRKLTDQNELWRMEWILYELYCKKRELAALYGKQQENADKHLPADIQRIHQMMREKSELVRQLEYDQLVLNQNNWAERDAAISRKRRELQELQREEHDFHQREHWKHQLRSAKATVEEELKKLDEIAHIFFIPVAQELVTAKINRQRRVQLLKNNLESLQDGSCFADPCFEQDAVLQQYGDFPKYLSINERRPHLPVQATLETLLRRGYLRPYMEQFVRFLIARGYSDLVEQPPKISVDDTIRILLHRYEALGIKTAPLLLLPQLRKKKIPLLLDLGVQPTAVDGFGRTALFYAATLNEALTLLQHGADPFHRDQNGDLVIHYMTRHFPEEGECYELIAWYGGLSERDSLGHKPMDFLPSSVTLFQQNKARMIKDVVEFSPFRLPPELCELVVEMIGP